MADTNKIKEILDSEGLLHSLDPDYLGGKPASDYALVQDVVENEEVTAAALNNLNERLSEIEKQPIGYEHPETHPWSILTDVPTATTSQSGITTLVSGDLNGRTYGDGEAASVAHTHSQYLTSHQDISGKANVSETGYSLSVSGTSLFLKDKNGNILSSVTTQDTNDNTDTDRTSITVGGTQVTGTNTTGVTLVAGNNMSLTPDAANGVITIATISDYALAQDVEENEEVTAAALNDLNERIKELEEVDEYVHPTYTSASNGLYKVTVDEMGHVSATTSVSKADITKLGIPGSDTDTDRTSITVGSTNVTGTNATGVTLVAGDNVTLTPDAINGKITVSATDTVYTHPAHTAVSNGLYKVTVDGSGHVSATASVSKADITALGIPGSDTNTHLTNTLTIKGNSTDAVVFDQQSNKSLNIKGGGATTVSVSGAEIIISSTDNNTNTAHTHAAGSGLKISGSGGTSGETSYSVNTDYTTNDKNYKVQVDSTSGGLFVNVPWTDTNTNTWRPVQNNLTSDSETDSLSAKQGKVLKGMIDNLPTPMQFKGSIGTGGTITTLPSASSTYNGYVYKVITAGTYQSIACKVGDTLICNGTSWVNIPSGDEPSGTVTSVGISNGGGLSVSGSPITSSGTITIAHGNTSDQASVNNSGRTYIQDITLDEYGHITGIASATETVTDTHLTNTFTVNDNDGTQVVQFTQNANKTLQIKAGDGITATKTADGVITITNTAPDVNHDTHYTNTLTIQGNGTEAVKFTQNADKTLNIVPGSNVSISASSGKITISATDTVYTHPSYTAKSSGLYKITVDGTGHVSAATAVAKADITALGIPGSDTNTDRTSITVGGTNVTGTNATGVTLVAGSNVTLTPDATNGKITVAATNTDTHYTTGFYVGASTGASNAAQSDPYLKIFDNTTLRSAKQIIAGNGISVSSDANGNITITNTKPDVNHNTDTKVTAVGNHYTPSGGSAATQTSGSAIGWGGTAITGITIDAAGHITGVTKGAIPANPNTDTKNTAGSTDTGSKIFLIGATSQAANPQTYSHDTAYVGTDGCLYSGGSKVLTSHQDISGKANVSETGYSLAVSGTSVSLKDKSGNVLSTITTQDTNTDTKVTSVGNHYTPAADSSAALSASASGATAAWSIDVVKAVQLQRDAKGHVTGVTVTSGKIPANPNTDTKVTAVGNHYTPSTSSNTTKSASGGTATNATGSGNAVQVVTGVTIDAAGHVTGVTSKGIYSTDTNTDTKNTAGSTNTSSKIFLVGATSQAANPQTYSDDEVYTTSGVLTTKSLQVGGGSATMQYDSTNECIKFVFA